MQHECNLAAAVQAGSQLSDILLQPVSIIRSDLQARTNPTRQPRFHSKHKTRSDTDTHTHTEKHRKALVRGKVCHHTGTQHSKMDHTLSLVRFHSPASSCDIEGWIEGATKGRKNFILSHPYKNPQLGKVLVSACVCVWIWMCGS